MISDHSKSVAYRERSSGLLGSARTRLGYWLLGSQPVRLDTSDDRFQASIDMDIETEEMDEYSLAWPSLDAVYEEVKDRIDVQNDQIKTLDAKANFGLVAATLLTAGVTGLGRALVESQAPDAGITPTPASLGILGWNIEGAALVDWVTVLSLGAYVVAAIGAYFAYRLRDFKVSPNPISLRENYLDKDPAYTKGAITNSRVKDYLANEDVIKGKVRWTNVAMAALVAEAILLLLIGLVQVWWV